MEVLTETRSTVPEGMSNQIDLTVAIIGCREFNDYAYLKEMCELVFHDLRIRCNKLNMEVRFKIISGGARGADGLAKVYAQYKHWPFKEYLPKFKIEGRRFTRADVKDYFERNIEMAEAANIVLAFLKKGEKNRGSLHMIKSSLEREKEVHSFWR